MLIQDHSERFERDTLPEGKQALEDEDVHVFHAVSPEADRGESR